jgi:uncharacterized protein (DUF302 family)
MIPLDHGLVHLRSGLSAFETVSVLESIVVTKGLSVMARIDHAAEAARVGLKMLPTGLLLIGNPLYGTPVMIASPTVSIDLPLKALVWQEVAGRVWISYNSPLYLQERHDIPPDLMATIGGISLICEEAAHSNGISDFNHQPGDRHVRTK